MNATLRERLICAEQQFLLAVAAGDEESLEAFSQEWSQLRDDIKSIKAARRLDDHMALLLSKVSRAIESTTLCMLESGAMLQSHSIHDVIQNIPFDDPSTASLHSQAIAPLLLFSDVPSSTSKILGQQKLLDSYAYTWLMQNIHDPYPSPAQTRILSDISDTSAVQVELWFQEVRDSIGWRKLLHDFFADSVNATVAAARRVFLERDKNISFDIVFAFTTVKAFAETLFLECPALERKKDDTGSITAIRTTDMGQDRQMGSSLDDYINSSDSILVSPQVNLRALDPLSDLSDSDESEEEDTSPPPPIAGCKRLLAEDEPTSQVAGPGSPLKRRRTRSIYPTHSSKPECPHPLPLTLDLSTERTISCISATPVSSFPSPHPLSPAPSPDPSPSTSQKRGCVEDTLEFAEGPIHVHVPVHGTRKRRLSQCISPSASKRQCRISISSEANSATNPTPPSDGCQDLSLPQGRPPDPDESPQPTLQAPLDTDIPIDLGVFDWNSISDPLVGAAPPMSQPPLVYVPGSDLSSQLLEPPIPVDLGVFDWNSISDPLVGSALSISQQPVVHVPSSDLLSQLEPPIPVDLGVFDYNSIPDPLVGSAPSLPQPPVIYVPSSDLSSQLREFPNPGHDATFTSSFNDLGSLQDLRSLLQLPMHAGPDLTASFAALPHEDDFSFSLEDLDLENLDWSTITDFDNLFPPDPTQWSSPSTTSSGPLTPPDNSFESLPSSQSSDASGRPLSQRDPSVPPSVLLPFGSGAFIEDVNNMCFLLPEKHSDPVAHTS